MGKKLTTEEFISKAKIVHGDKYDYSKVHYVNARTKVCISCPHHGCFFQLPSRHLSGDGCPSCPHTFGKYGILDLKGATNSKAYGYWKSMLVRCYSDCYHTHKPTYIGCTVCDEWHTFSRFKEWFDEHYTEGYHLDKDILTKGNKVYSPHTCCFLPIDLNSLLTTCKKSRGQYPIGVSIHGTKYQSYLHKKNKLAHLGTFDTPYDAFNAYKIAKEQYIKELAETYFQEGKITKKVYDALMKYEVEITD